MVGADVGIDEGGLGGFGEPCPALAAVVVYTVVDGSLDRLPLDIHTLSSAGYGEHRSREIGGADTLAVKGAAIAAVWGDAAHCKDVALARLNIFYPHTGRVCIADSRPAVVCLTEYTVVIGSGWRRPAELYAGVGTLSRLESRRGYVAQALAYSIKVALVYLAVGADTAHGIGIAVARYRLGVDEARLGGIAYYSPLSAFLDKNAIRIGVVYSLPADLDSARVISDA